MNNFIKKISEKNEQILKNKGLSADTNINYLLEKLFLIGFEISIVLGFLVYFPALFVFINLQQYAISVIITLLLLTLLLSLVFGSVKLNYRVSVFLFFLFLLGILMIIKTDIYGSGLMFLLAFSVIASIFMGLKAAIATIAINLVSLLIIAIFIRLKPNLLSFQNIVSLEFWLAITVIFLIINSIISLAIAYFVKEVNKSFQREAELKRKFRKKSERLIEAKAKAEESDHLKSAFLANVSHEFRTPMNAIIGFTDIMLYSETNQEKRKFYLENIQKSSEQLLEIINNTIEYSKIELGTVVFEPAEFDIYEILAIIQEQLKPKCPKKVDFIVSQYLNNERIKIISDRYKMVQVFTNLILNAFKFTEKGSVSFGLMEYSDKDYYQFFVKDTGIGITNEKQKDIFTRFTKADDFKEGTGLGLSISATLIYHMGGRIWLESEPNVGTTFYFILPVILQPVKDDD